KATFSFNVVGVAAQHPDAEDGTLDFYSDSVSFCPALILALAVPMVSGAFHSGKLETEVLGSNC
ncbi:MAG: hypothetical protein ACK550_03145, partial [Synechococcaceae cyanobacterium]